MLKRSEGLADSTKHHLQKIQEIRPHVSGRSSDQSTQLGHLSHLSPMMAAEVRKLQLYPVQIMCESCAGIIQRICLFSEDFYSDSTLI
jgi:hypothetical protein